MVASILKLDAFSSVQPEISVTVSSHGVPP